MSGQSIPSATAIENEALALTKHTQDRPREAVEVAVLWNKEIWQVDTLGHSRNEPIGFYIGEEPDCDFTVPAELLEGSAKVPLVIQANGETQITVPHGAKGFVTYPDGTFEQIGEMTGARPPDVELAQPPGTGLPLPFGSTAELSLGPWTFRIRSHTAEQRFSSAWTADWAPNFYTGLSLVLHAAFLFLIFLVPPGNAFLIFDPVDQESRFFKYVIAPPQQKIPELPDILEKQAADTGEANQGMRHQGPEGKAGKRDAPEVNRRYAIKKIKDTMEVHMARPSEDMVKTAGILGFLNTQNAPTSPFGQETANGLDPENALGNLIGPEIGDAFGVGGLGISGTGRGGGGDGSGTLGVGRLKFLGTGYYGTGKGSGIGRFKTEMKGRRPAGPKIVSRGAMVSGSLSKEVIRREIRRRLNEVSFCYEKGLEKRPDLAGRVAIKFTISPSGAVQVAVVYSSTLGDPQVEQCIARTIGRISFPQPIGGGIVIVTYPFDLQSSEN